MAKAESTGAERGGGVRGVLRRTRLQGKKIEGGRRFLKKGSLGKNMMSVGSFLNQKRTEQKREKKNKLMQRKKKKRRWAGGGKKD